MKKVFLLLFAVVILVIIDVFFVKYIFRDKILSTDIAIPFDNSCVVDDDCTLTEYYGDFGHTCPDRIVDYSEDKYVAVSKSSLSEYTQKKDENEAKTNNACLLFMPAYKNKNYQSTCYQNECTKIRGSLIHKIKD
ncbi:MAG: hypothetical protein HYV41_02645 [Candidatus Magasanikbacteria bacterium]|nr:hypothetical protein [Candidatus Magasanikbacteria bacterium]